jgi:hypothetical protein
MIARTNKINGVLIKIPRPTAIDGTHYRTNPTIGTDMFCHQKRCDQSQALLLSRDGQAAAQQEETGAAKAAPDL